MRHKNDRYLKQLKPSKNLLRKFLPFLIFLTIFAIGISIGIANPTSPPPGPT